MGHLWWSVPVVACAAGMTVALSGGEAVPAPTGPVSEAAARDLLRSKWEQAQRRDPVAYCADHWMPDGCATDWLNAGGSRAVPDTYPRVVSTRTQGDYRWLHLCGTDGTGAAYESDFVMGSDRRLVFSVFWDGRTLYSVDDGDVPHTTNDVTPKVC